MSGVFSEYTKQKSHTATPNILFEVMIIEFVQYIKINNIINILKDKTIYQFSIYCKKRYDLQRVSYSGTACSNVHQMRHISIQFQ